MNKKNKYPNNFTLKITLNTNNNNYNIINNNINSPHTKTGGSMNKLIPGIGDLNLYQNHNLNVIDKNIPTFSNNIPKITNINTINVKNSIKNKITLNDLLNFNNGKIINNINNKNLLGLKLKSLNKKSISFYNNFAFNELINNKNNNDRHNFQKNKKSQLDMLNLYSNSGRNSYVNIKNKNGGNLNMNQNENKYHFSSEEKYKIKLGKPINICSIKSNDNNNKKHIPIEFKGKKMIHNLTEGLLSGDNRIAILSINSKNKI